MTQVQELKRRIRQFLQALYSDEHLAMALAHARDGKLFYESCCCLIGIPTADHPLRGISFAPEQGHYLLARSLDVIGAERAFYFLGFVHANAASLLDKDLKRTLTENDLRRRILIPMLRAEMKRREWERAKAERARVPGARETHETLSLEITTA